MLWLILKYNICYQNKLKFNSVYSRDNKHIIQ